LEKKTIGKENKEASSFSYTRSIRNDYLDPLYATMAYEAQLLWKILEKKQRKNFLLNVDVLILQKNNNKGFFKNLCLSEFSNLKKLRFKTEKYNKKKLQKRFPQFDVDEAFLDIKAGFLYLPPITNLLLKLLKEKGITINENIEITKIKEKNNNTVITTNGGNYETKNLVITAGRWVNDVLALIEKNELSFPITWDRPQECKYFYPDKNKFNFFIPENLPVFAYLDVGIYGHPVFDKKKGAMKIGFYNPPDFDRKKSAVKSIEDFINTCMPMLKNVRSETVTDADQCSYDLVADDNFIIGKLPNYKNIIVGAGWRGTGYKFAPLIGKILSQLALQNGTVYDIKQFSPARFTK